MTVEARKAGGVGLEASSKRAARHWWSAGPASAPDARRSGANEAETQRAATGRLARAPALIVRPEHTRLRPRASKGALQRSLSTSTLKSP
eukprot:1160360-Alexandrium_andersonii.AAC.1